MFFGYRNSDDVKGNRLISERAMDTNSTHITLTAANFPAEVLKSIRPVFVEFTADWSGSSHIMAPVIKELASSFKDYIKFCRIDVDTQKEVAEKYAVQHIPTFLLFRAGQTVDSIVGAVPKKVLARKLIALLPSHDG